MAHNRRLTRAVSPRRTRLAPDNRGTTLICFYCMESGPTMRHCNLALQHCRLHSRYLLRFGTCGRRRLHASRALARASLAVATCRAAAVATCTARAKPAVAARRTLTGAECCHRATSTVPPPGTGRAAVCIRGAARAPAAGGARARAFRRRRLAEAVAAGGAFSTIGFFAGTPTARLALMTESSVDSAVAPRRASAAAHWLCFASVTVAAARARAAAVRRA